MKKRILLVPILPLSEGSTLWAATTSEVLLYPSVLAVAANLRRCHKWGLSARSKTENKCIVMSSSIVTEFISFWDYGSLDGDLKGTT
ncbi:hypothetical protein SLA2020_019950 [Shorea laevis]